MQFDASLVERALGVLAERLLVNDSPKTRLVICGGSALIVAQLVSRVTADVDVVALVDSQGSLISPSPFPEYLLVAAKEVAAVIGNLDENWLNNGPSLDSGGLYQMGLPEGLLSRSQRREYGPRLVAFFIGRLDQIHLKVFGSADRGGVHVDDLMALQPTEGEIHLAARWCLKHDPSAGFREILISMLKQLGYGNAAARL